MMISSKVVDSEEDLVSFVSGLVCLSHDLDESPDFLNVDFTKIIHSGKLSVFAAFVLGDRHFLVWMTAAFFPADVSPQGDSWLIMDFKTGPAR